METYRKIFVDYFKLFSPKEWRDVSAKLVCNYDVNANEREITVTFKFKEPYINASFLKNLWDFSKDRTDEKHEGAIRLVVINSIESKEQAVNLINQYFNLIEVPITLSPEQTDLMDYRLEIRKANLIVPHKDNLQLFLRFAINKAFEIELPAPKKDQHQLYLFHIEEKSDLKGNKKYKLGLTDWEVFYWLALKADFKGKLEIGKWYGCSYSLFAEGSIYSNFSDGNITSLTLADVQEEPKRDLCEKKLVPLCIHTKYSAFDGLYKFKDFAQKAKEYGHSALGVADLASVQSFAEVESVSKELGIKPIYGTELELYDENYYAFLNTELKTSNTYCVFDIETTGLNPLFDEITEIAIHKYIDLQKVDEYHSYIKIKKTLRERIINLTRITDEKLEQYGRELPLVLREIKDFVGDGILVAHNGIEFDLPFLNAKYAQNNLEGFNVPFIDTMRLSQILFFEEKYKSHSLEAISKRNGGDYSPTEAHSAGYDVTILWEVFSRLLIPQLERVGIDIEDSWEGLNERLINPNIFKYVHGHNVLIYAKNKEGIRDLYEILSIAHTTSFHDRAMISKSTLNKYRENLLIVSPPLNSEIIGLLFKNNEKELLEVAKFYDYLILPPVSHFVHDIDREIIEEQELVKALKRLFELLNSNKLLFNTAVRYLNSRESEQYLVLIHTKAISGKRHYLFDGREKNDVFPLFFYRNTEELLNEYAFLGREDLGELAFNNQETFLAEIEDNLEVTKKKLHPPSIEGCESLLKKQCKKKLKELYGKELNSYIKNKFEFELNSIVNNNYTVIYWVSHLLVTESINNGFLVGSRGSVGSSFVAFLLNISEVNPLPPHYRCANCSYFEILEDFPESGFDLPTKICEGCGKELARDGHNIPFETFLGFGGNKVPDIDLNFSGEYQNKAHNFLRNYFGKERVYRAGTISAMAEKTAFAIVRDYLEETGKNYSQGRINWLVKQIIDVKRTTGQHPGGILIVPNDYTIYDFSPINYPANDITSDWLTTHLEFNDLHDALLKFDILGHDDPTTLARLKKLTGFDPLNVPISDPNVLALYSSCQVLGVEEGDYVDGDNTGAIGLPEFGTLLTRKILKTCKPKSFADLIRISGFSHGTGVWKGNIDKFIKDGTHKLNEVITCRDDIMLYLLSMGLEREDAFNITESIRKGHGVSAKAEKILKNHNIPDWYISSAKKISYIFPKAHATAYVLMSWRIAYYKYYYPLHFYAVWFTLRAEDFDYSLLINNNIDEVRSKYHDIFERMKSNKFAVKSSVKNKEKTAFYVYEAALEFLKRGFKFRTISINESDYSDFKPLGKELLVPFIVIEGLGAIKAQALTKEREEGGEYTSLEDLIKRTKLNKTVIQKLKDSKIIPEEWLYS
ncbi:DNA polymerase III subunit alpha [Candidatus Mycoplasma haematobovis]|uniref:DNA polymerase III PolC-type n=1 Tax=Candidatus Mycoplasma haematobovis TaxID=432608 RepID=A0A1A9QDT8_9MOLU|nr:PolC-type DNA polymerase III [Candidatus Mycoplasma haematobovis]OAL09859.1 DNA polymerase III subunit alpha [Candidatus Mycoplasma haematobovis]